MPIELRNRFGAIAASLQPAVQTVVNQTAERIKAAYQERCRVDTGAQRASAYVATSETSGYSDGVQAARSANPSVQVGPDVGTQPALAAAVAIPVSYAGINEFGGRGRSGDGALTQAVEEQRQPFFDAIQKAITGG